MNIFNKNIYNFVKSLFPSFFTQNEETTVQDSKVAKNYIYLQESEPQEELNMLDADQIPQLDPLKLITRTQAYGSTRFLSVKEHKPKEMFRHSKSLLNQPSEEEWICY